MRNIVVVTWDSVRADHVSCYGYEKETTPFLDRIASQGVKFENAIVGGVPTDKSVYGMTTSDFCPIGSGVSPEQWRVHMRKKDTIFEALSNKGYQTGVFTQQPSLSSAYGTTKGSNYEYTDFLSKGREKQSKFKRVISPLLKKFDIYSEVAFMKNFIKGEAGYPSIQNIYHDMIERAKRIEEPYFIWIFLVDTHYSYMPPREFTRSQLGMRKRLWIDYKYRKIMKSQSKKTPKAESIVRNILYLSENEQKLIIDNYDGAIRYVDSILKRLWNDLKDTDPVFIVNSDHGEAFGEHSLYGHPPEHYEYLIKVPLVIYNASVKGRIESPVSLLRFAPTVCELGEIENKFRNPSLFEDISYHPPIVENKLEDGLRVTVRDKEWKLITNPDREDELYNIREDPLEYENLIEEEKDEEKELRRVVESHMKTRARKERLRERIQKLKEIERI